eukprot:SAG31_NODE_2882_length_4955_cov_22.807455_5_plen_85_part_01
MLVWPGSGDGGIGGGGIGGGGIGGGGIPAPRAISQPAGSRVVSRIENRVRVEALIDNKKRLMPKQGFRLYLLSVPAPVFYYISYF